MANGNDQSFYEAWQELRESFVRRLARKYYGLEISEIGIRAYEVSKKPLTAVLAEIRRKNIFESTMFRAGRRIRVILRRNPTKRN